MEPGTKKMTAPKKAAPQDARGRALVTADFLRYARVSDRLARPLIPSSLDGPFCVS